MPKLITIKTKKKVLRDIIANVDSRDNIAKSNNISINSLFKIQRENKDLFVNLMDTMRNQVTAHALLKAGKCLKRLKKDKIEKSSGIQLSQMATNLYNINKQDTPVQIHIGIQAPVGRDELISQILDVDNISVDNTIVNNGSKAE